LIILTYSNYGISNVDTILSLNGKLKVPEFNYNAKFQIKYRQIRFDTRLWRITANSYYYYYYKGQDTSVRREVLAIKFTAFPWTAYQSTQCLQTCTLIHMHYLFNCSWWEFAVIKYSIYNCTRLKF